MVLVCVLVYMHPCLCMSVYVSILCQYICLCVGMVLPASSLITMLGLSIMRSHSPSVSKGLKSKPVYSSSSAYHDWRGDLWSPCSRSNALSSLQCPPTSPSSKMFSLKLQKDILASNKDLWRTSCRCHQDDWQTHQTFSGLNKNSWHCRIAYEQNKRDLNRPREREGGREGGGHVNI